MLLLLSGFHMLLLELPSTHSLIYSELSILSKAEDILASFDLQSSDLILVLRKSSIFEINYY